MPLKCVFEWEVKCLSREVADDIDPIASPEREETFFFGNPDSTVDYPLIRH